MLRVFVLLFGVLSFCGCSKDDGVSYVEGLYLDTCRGGGYGLDLEYMLKDAQLVKKSDKLRVLDLVMYQDGGEWVVVLVARGKPAKRFGCGVSLPGAGLPLPVCEVNDDGYAVCVGRYPLRPEYLRSLIINLK